MAMTKPLIVSTAQLRNHIGDVLGNVQYGGREVIVTKRGKPVARISPVKKGGK